MPVLPGNRRSAALDEDEGERQSSRRSHEMDELPGGRPRQSRKDARRPESTYCARAFLVLVNVGGIIFGSLILYYGLRAYVRLKAEQDINGVHRPFAAVLAGGSGIVVFSLFGLVQYTYIHTCMPAYMQNLHTCMHACIHACMHACIHTHVYTFMHTHTHIHTHTHTYNHTHTHKYIHTYINT